MAHDVYTPEAQRRRQEEIDGREAREFPVADELARRCHERRHRRGQAYYRWELMQPEYRRGERQTMQFVVELLGAENVARALEGSRARDNGEIA